MFFSKFVWSHRTNLKDMVDLVIPNTFQRRWLFGDTTGRFLNCWSLELPRLRSFLAFNEILGLSQDLFGVKHPLTGRLILRHPPYLPKTPFFADTKMAKNCHVFHTVDWVTKSGTKVICKICDRLPPKIGNYSGVSPSKKWQPHFVLKKCPFPFQQLGLQLMSGVPRSPSLCPATTHHPVILEDSIGPLPPHRILRFSLATVSPIFISLLTGMFMVLSKWIIAPQVVSPLNRL